MSGNNRFEIRTPVRFGFKQVFLINLLAAVPSFIVGGLFGGCGVGLVIILCSDAPYWRLYLPLCGFALSLMMLFFFPYLLFVNYYIRAIVANRQTPEAGFCCICQVATTPRICAGLRAVLEDADDVGVLRLHADRIEFKGDHLDFSITPKSVNLCNIGWRGLWFAGQRIRFQLDDHAEFREIEVVERQSFNISQSRTLARQIYQASERLVEAMKGQNSIA